MPTLIDRPQMHLLCSDHHGQYIPQRFAQSINRDNVRGLTDEDWMVLETGPSHEWYWETWDDVLNNAVLIDSDGVRYTLHQDGDLWAIPEGMEWSDEDMSFYWPYDNDAAEPSSTREFWLRENEPLCDRIAWFVMVAAFAAAVTIGTFGIITILTR